ncbi:MgtC/SapB family protein [Metabacillus malikii]|nr:MgtC/SapB family protein [Metabacillus malikii]
MQDDTIMIFLRIFVATILCGLIGLEREINNHPAGFRTHLLVGIGACLMMILSLYGFKEYINENGNIRFDPARIPSYVISGIGFLGGGTILVKGATVRGLTTAASIWIVAGLGLVIGAGMYIVAIFTTILVLMCLIFLNRLEKIMNRRKLAKKVKLITHSNDLSVEQIIDKLHTYDVKVTKFSFIECYRNESAIISYRYLLDINFKADYKKKIESIMCEIPHIEKIY